MNRALVPLLVLALAGLVQGCKCQPSLNNNNNNKDKDDPPLTGTLPTDSGDLPVPCDRMEREPNNGVAEATRLPPETILCGIISEPGDIDVFVSDVEEDGWLAVQAEARAIGSFADVQVQIVPPTGSGANRGDDEGTTDVHLLFPGDAGQWAIQLSEQFGNGGESYFYEVALSVSKPPVEWTVHEVEPNDTIGAAMPVSDGDIVFGDMKDNVDSDYFRIDVPTGKHTVTARVTAYSQGSLGDFVAYLFDSQGGQLPEGCSFCAFHGDPIDAGRRDPVVEYESLGNESLYLRLAETDFRSGRPTWYIIAFTVEST